jgi:methylmalonyl-CoA mutase
MMKQEKLFKQFPAVTTKDWMDKIISDLKGADFHRKLVWKTREGFDVRPFYREEDTSDLPYIAALPGEYPYVRGTKAYNDWYIRQNIEVTDYHESNRKALFLLGCGVNSLGFNIIDPESVDEHNFAVLLSGIDPGKTELNFLCNGKAIEIVEIIIGILKSRGCGLECIRGAVETDPLGRLMFNGRLCIPVEKGLDYLASLTGKASSLPYFRVLQVNASLFGNAGSGIVEELALGISAGMEYLTQFTFRGLSAEYAASKIRFSFGTGSDYFMEIAKLRAARLLWSAIANGFKAAGSESFKMMIHSQTTSWNKTLYDPYVNMLRTQTEAMSASLGGADSITVLPFDIAFRQPDEFSERIARNQQLLLKEEAYFNKITDPAAGSYYLENLTHLVAGSAWKLFLEIEEKGGFLEALKKGIVQDILGRSAAGRKEDVAKRKVTLLGTNQYPDTTEVVRDIDRVKLFNQQVTEDDPEVEPVRLWRGAEEFERLRLSVDASANKPSVFLFTIGDKIMSRARAQFSSSFFACGGYHIIDNTGFCDVGEGVQAALGSNAQIVVICSSDDEYSKFAPPVFEKLKDKVIVVVAGNPPCIDELKASGIEHFISIRSDVAASLKLFNQLTGIEKK